MVNFNLDNTSAFYLTMAIVTLAFALVVVFGKTEENISRKRRTTTAS